MRFDNRNGEVFPTRGVFWETELISAAGLTNTSDPITKLSSDMTIYASLRDPAKLVAVVSFGGTKIFSKSFEYFQAASIGNNNTLNGFRKNRYTGKSSLYGSMELRMKLLTIKSYILPGPLGLRGFYDIGRVWMPGEHSQKWHSGYGGGIYFIPFNMFMISASVGFSGKENIYNVIFGSKITLSF
jgi:outer membrane protein assembly factor BamA